MSRTLLQRDNISIIGEIIKCKDIVTGKECNPTISLTFTILINGKLKVWGTNYELEKIETEFTGETKLKDYHSWNDLIDFLQTLGYDMEDANINKWISCFEI